MPPSSSVSRLINLFFMTNRSLHQHMQKNVTTSFSFIQFLTIQFVRENGPVNMKDIARFLSITPASATSLVNGLVKSGVLVRTADMHDRRIIRLHASSYGKEQLGDAEKQAKSELKRIFLRLSSNDRNKLAAVLGKLSDIISRGRGDQATGMVKQALK
jgi:DNA-binding MarR family transcriptional regulator